MDCSITTDCKKRTLTKKRPHTEGVAFFRFCNKIEWIKYGNQAKSSLTEIVKSGNTGIAEQMSLPKQMETFLMEV